MPKPAKPPKAMKSHQCAAKVLQPGDGTTPPNLLAEVSAHLQSFTMQPYATPQNWIIWMNLPAIHEIESNLSLIHANYHQDLLDMTNLVGWSQLSGLFQVVEPASRKPQDPPLPGVLCHWCGWRILDVRVPTPDKKRGLFFSHLAYVEWFFLLTLGHRLAAEAKTYWMTISIWFETNMAQNEASMMSTTMVFSSCLFEVFITGEIALRGLQDTSAREWVMHLNRSLKPKISKADEIWWAGDTVNSCKCNYVYVINTHVI